MFLKLIGGFFVCLWAADFVTGLAHWLEDTYCLENYPLIGSFICEPNIEHHVDPQLMVREGTFFSRNLLQWSLCGAMYGLLWLVGLGGIFTFTILLMASFGNEIHRWNHMSKTNGFVTFMKDSGLIQIQKQHSLHHKQPHNQYYCVMTSLLNAVLERINFWRKLEWTVEAITGIAPKRENRRDSQPLKKKKRKTQSKPTQSKPTQPKTTQPQPATAIAKDPGSESAGKATKEVEPPKAKQPMPANPGPSKPAKPARKLPGLPVLESLKPALDASKAACLAAAKTGCRNCKLCKLATNPG